MYSAPVNFTNFLSCWFTKLATVNPLDKKLLGLTIVKRVECTKDHTVTGAP